MQLGGVCRVYLQIIDSGHISVLRLKQPRSRKYVEYPLPLIFHSIFVKS
jgi:hypothetical protein